jgi:RNA polymerase sigma factor (sigma-70 family)
LCPQKLPRLRQLLADLTRCTDVMSYDAQFDELAKLAFRVAYRILGNRAEAEEVAQEALTKAFVRWRRVSGHARPWVGRVSTNLALGVVRKRGRPPQPTSVVADKTHEVVVRMELQQVLLSLPRRQREVVALRYVADLSEAVVAAELGCSVGAVKTHAHRGLAALRQGLGPQPLEVN